MPRHSICSRWVDHEPVAKRTHASVKPVSSSRACGARPSAGGPSQLGWPCERRPGSGAKGGFSEGRTLCVREYGSDASRGIPFPTDGFTISRWPRGHMSRSSRCLPCGRAEPAPPRDGQAKARRPSGGKPGDDAKGGFLGDTVLGCQASLV
jgi:hypothetical protein